MDFGDLSGGRGKRDTPIHPGEILFEEFMEPLQLSASALARELHVPANRVTALINGQRSVTADTALRLARYFGTTAEFWLRLQVDFDLRETARRVSDMVRKPVSPQAR
ncbi:MAG: HigA family addiction module antitoxin [Halofilum sp. (in: g-proteobacteria)]|nr:HigA family addiction module antitoxin [Halofilum sp. (in: g-proteobacteria)]